MYGIEKSFLEAEFHCHNGYKLIKKSPKRKSASIAASSGKNLICKKRRWLGQKPFCREIKKPSALQQCDSHEAQKCEQLCIKSGNRTEASCLCHKGFRLIGTQCLGKFKFFIFCSRSGSSDDTWKMNSNIFFISYSLWIFFIAMHTHVDINECEENSGSCGHGKCINLIGAFKCFCQQGFQLDGSGKCVGKLASKIPHIYFMLSHLVISLS